MSENIQKTDVEKLQTEFEDTKKKLAESEFERSKITKELEEAKAKLKKAPPPTEAEVGLARRNASLADMALAEKLKDALLHGKSLRAAKEEMKLKDSDIARLSSRDKALCDAIQSKFPDFLHRG